MAKVAGHIIVRLLANKSLDGGSTFNDQLQWMKLKS